MPGAYALVVAAGRGTRFGGDVPKQYQVLAGRSVLGHSLAAFAGHPGIRGVRAVIHGDDRERYADTARGLAVLDPVEGGATRQESVRRGLESLAPLTPDRVLIHDAARPCVGPATIAAVIAALDAAVGAVPALPVSDALMRGAGDRITTSVDRGGLWRAQTPQGFRFDAILAAHRAATGTDHADDVGVAQAAGHDVAIVPGDEDNLKVTAAGDLARAARVLGGGETRVGQGFDVHRFGPGDHVMLGGVRVPHERGLVGHSDADVLLHALVDALLGAVGGGDIGQHFPPADERWRGAESWQFVGTARRMIEAAGGRIDHVDLTLIGERPRLGPHRDAIRARVAALLGIGEARVNVKATTTEGLGFTGRGEGIAALATATVRLP
ncbi:MAG: bifunctional 2-C-methyl-D-erythritol 4-phosphate cytidylyltransferase/2-C-methyl-D-erythritol 2,4-cyclodiphosphate synthase [Alphaproteobacteria bacterium]|nr:bifunctional 2-C-methyl-D-erythritol 4-phosphate cytidylyltransferase/2-C-methyl-D-erythritol 2,4-cyclodiphosphate synthase [Alphaproteobacteria bacterium]